MFSNVQISADIGSYKLEDQYADIAFGSIYFLEPSCCFILLPQVNLFFFFYIKVPFFTSHFI